LCRARGVRGNRNHNKLYLDRNLSKKKKQGATGAKKVEWKGSRGGKKKQT